MQLSQPTNTGQSVGIVPAAHRAAAEHHLILSQSPCLVREDVLDLAQVFSDVEGSTLERPVSSFVVHVQVPVEEVDLYYLDYLNCYVQ